ncbi:hypothetical protein ABZT04_42370 [Streptomyces sp. NPDC005492]|uniref:hypothetical protein n=1 Tax=Streptomyces sp. NPDC005492 TaxID=3156883 RepID=UPI0033BE515F
MHTEHVQRSYSFACLVCGYGWEDTYDIDVTVDEYARITAAYQLDGKRVPSPLQSPCCPACESRKVRIMRPGRVASARLHER